MPKRGGGGTRNRHWKTEKDHFEHDDRGQSNIRRVSFKPGIKKYRDNKIRNFNLDDDIDMGGTAGGPGGRLVQGRPFRGRGGRRNSPAPRTGPGMKRQFVAGIHPWYQVTIPYGAKHEKDDLFRALLSYMSPDVFVPQYYKIAGNAASFYVEDVRIAEKLFNADRKIAMPDGFKLVILVRNSLPNVKIDEALKERMKLIMAKRYNATTKALDLTKFHADPDFSDMFCALFRPMVMLTAIDIIAANIPDLEALNLNDNKLHGIEHLRILSSKLKSLKILYLGDNKISYIGSLDSLKGLPLVELYLKGNPLTNRFQDHEIYVSDVRKKFPKLTRLDGVDLPPPIGFDVAEDMALPAFVQSFIPDPDTQQGLVRDFLTQYFAIYDSDSRHSLLDAYHENATLSMTCNFLANDTRHNTNPAARLNAYLPTSRNLLRITERESRRRNLKVGRLQVVSLLSDLPKSTHDLLGFAVDVLVFTPGMIVLSVNGVFKEKTVHNNPTRSVHRTFVIVPNATGGFCIVNDIMYITNTTTEQESRAFASGSPPPALGAAPPPAPAASDDHKTLLLLLAQKTGMNEHWSMNCLQETSWNLERALFIFNQLQSEGKIPPEAFIK